MDIFSVLGFIIGIGAILISLLTSGSIATFIDIPSVFIVVGGTVGSVLVSCKGKNLKKFFKLINLASKENKTSEIELIENFTQYITKARREGLLALEDSIEEIKDSFIKEGLMMVIDGMDAEVIKRTLSIKMKAISERHKNNRGVFDTGAALAPAFGMIGTLIGLVNMLKNLSDPSSIGPQMSVALITTFYGSLLANVFFMPISKKLKAKTSEEIFQKEMVVEALLILQAGESPTVMRKKLLAYLDEKDRSQAELENNKEE